MLFVLLLLFNISDPANATASALPNKDQFLEIQQISEKLLSDYPEALFVGVGQSSTPFVAYLSLAVPGKVVALPYSAAGARFVHGELSLNSKQMQENLRQNFAYYVPAHLIKKFMQVVLIDYSRTGKSLLAAHVDLRDYLQSLGLVGVETVSVGVTATPERFVHEAKHNLTALLIPNGSRLHEALETEVWKPYSPYGKYYSNDPPELRSVSANFERFQSHLQSQMSVQNSSPECFRVLGVTK